ncbi:MAG: DMT family transporter [Spirochaetales bacterium]|nr:DMT family transporter [Spirochaetales bacterium]
MIISSLCFAFMSASVKQAGSLSFIQKVLFRNMVMVIAVLPVLLKKSVKAGNQVLIGKPENRPKLVMRSLFGFFGVLCYFVSIERLNLGDSAMLNKMSSFFVIILSAIFIGDKIKFYHIPALIAAFAGTLLIIKPGFDVSPLPAVIGLTGALLAAGAYTSIASLKGQEDSLTIILWFSVISTVISLVPAIIMWQQPTGLEFIALIGTGVFAAGGQYFLTKAYSYGKAGEISIYNYTQVFFSVLISFIVWNDIPDALSITGSILIIAAAVGLYLKGRKTS